MKFIRVPHKISFPFGRAVLQAIEVIPFNDAAVDTAVKINAGLKRKKKKADLADLLIAATALTNDFAIATLNKKHFSQIENLIVID